jgi:adenylate kinase family enzyme
MRAGYRMRKVAVFGNTGGGKSTLASRLAEVTGLPLHPLDRIEYKAGGEAILTSSAEVDHRWLWRCRLGLGAVLCSRHAGLH